MDFISKRFHRHKCYVVLLLALASLGLVLSLNFSGFCYSEFRYLSRQELLDRFLFGSTGDTLTADQKARKASEIGFEYPNCCRITERKEFLERLLGYYVFEIESHKVNISRRLADGPKYMRISSANSCGTKILHMAGMSESQKSYDTNIRSIAKTWEVEK